MKKKNILNKKKFKKQTIPKFNSTINKSIINKFTPYYILKFILIRFTH